MEKMWAGRFAKALDKEADDFNSSISFDSKMYKQDITGSIAHAAMLAKCGIITDEECGAITDCLAGILDDIEAGTLIIDPEAEDIHMFVESVLTQRIGDTGKKLHTARSRNDQVAVDLRLYLRDETAEIISALKTLVGTVCGKAKDNRDVIMRAIPIFRGHSRSPLLIICLPTA